MWSSAKEDVKRIFFKDLLTLYKVTVTTDSLGEDSETLVSLGSYSCNVQESEAKEQTTISGTSVPITLRVSTEKNIALSTGFAYKVAITSARLNLSSSDYWRVSSYVEGQLSTVLTVSREVPI